MAHGLERLTLIECDVGLITVKLLENLSTFGIAYVDVRFDSRFESVDHGIFAFLLGNDKVCTKSGRRELHLLNVIVSEGFFNTMIEVGLESTVHADRMLNLVLNLDHPERQVIHTSCPGCRRGRHCGRRCIHRLPQRHR